MAEGTHVDEGSGRLLFNRSPIPHHPKRKFPEPYPDYAKSLVGQNRGDPGSEGLVRGLKYGALGAVLSVLAAKMAGAGGLGTLAAGAGGGSLGFMAGYKSGMGERKSENTRLNFLKRLGVNSPGDYEALVKLNTPGEALKKGEAV